MFRLPFLHGAPTDCLPYARMVDVAGPVLAHIPFGVGSPMRIGSAWAVVNILGLPSLLIVVLLIF